MPPFSGWRVNLPLHAQPETEALRTAHFFQLHFEALDFRMKGFRWRSSAGRASDL